MSLDSFKRFYEDLNHITLIYLHTNCFAYELALYI